MNGAIKTLVSQFEQELQDLESNFSRLKSPSPRREGDLPEEAKQDTKSSIMSTKGAARANEILPRESPRARAFLTGSQPTLTSAPGFSGSARARSLNKLDATLNDLRQAPRVVFGKSLQQGATVKNGEAASAKSTETAVLGKNLHQGVKVKEGETAGAKTTETDGRIRKLMDFATLPHDAQNASDSKDLKRSPRPLHQIETISSAQRKARQAPALQPATNSDPMNEQIEVASIREARLQKKIEVALSDAPFDSTVPPTDNRAVLQCSKDSLPGVGVQGNASLPCSSGSERIILTNNHRVTDHKMMRQMAHDALNDCGTSMLRSAGDYDGMNGSQLPSSLESPMLTETSPVITEFGSMVLRHHVNSEMVKNSSRGRIWPARVRLVLQSEARQATLLLCLCLWAWKQSRGSDVSTLNGKTSDGCSMRLALEGKYLSCRDPVESHSQWEARQRQVLNALDLGNHLIVENRELTERNAALEAKNRELETALAEARGRLENGEAVLNRLDAACASAEMAAGRMAEGASTPPFPKAKARRPMRKS